MGSDSPAGKVPVPARGQVSARGCLLPMIIVLFLSSLPSAAQQAQPSEYQLKAAFLFNFAKFIDWPTNAFGSTNSPFVIGILGEDPFGEHLATTLRGKVVNERQIVLQRIESIGDGRQVHILFISNSEMRRLREVVAGLRDAPVLTVGENARFIEGGGMINFLVEGNKIRFQVSDSAAKRGGLKISSKLLSLAVSSK